VSTMAHATTVTNGGADAHAAAGATRVVATVADLATVLARLDPATPVTLDHVVRGAAGLSPDHHPHVVVADVGVYTCTEWATRPALELGARLVPEVGAPVQLDGYACHPMHRVAEAFDAGDLDDGLRAMADVLADAAHTLASDGSPWLPHTSGLRDRFAEVATVLREISSDLRSCLAPAAGTEMRNGEHV
jgi:hypothetical protein